MLQKLRIGAVVVAGASLLVGRPTITMAAPTPEASTCAQAKDKAMGLKVLKTLKCYSKAAKDGLDRNPTVNTDLGDCIAAVDADTTGRFGDADAAGGCAVDANAFNLNTPDANPDGTVASILSQANKGWAVNATTVGYIGIDGPTTPEYTNPNAGIVQLVAPGTAASLCAKKQFIALAVLGKKLFFCEKTAVKKNIPHELNHECVQKAIDTYAKKFDKAAGDCINTAARDTLAGYLTNLTNVIIPDIPRFDGCGNGLVTNGMAGTSVETCDDGNLENIDGCPADCVVDACTPDPMTPIGATLVISGPDALNVAALTVELDYPEGKIDLPGTGFGPASIQDLTFADSFDSVDFDHALRIVASSAGAFGTTDIASLGFVDCTGGTAPVPADFICTVKQAFGAGGTPDFTATTTCTVTIP